MEDGSPGFLSDLRFLKRSRTSEENETESNVGADPAPNPPLDSIPDPTSNTVAAPVSFRDTLMNKVPQMMNLGVDINSLSETHEELNDDEDVLISKGDRGPSIKFSERAMSCLCKPWQNALIIKLLGRSHTYNYMLTKLQQKWSLKGGWKLVDLVNDYFVVRFDLEEDLNFVLTGGPWIVAGQYLIMQKWVPGFCPATAKITRMAAWIRVSAIQLECFDVWALKRIGNLLGKLLKIDTLTTSQNRGKFARLCIELDLSKPLEAFLQINNVWYNIEYEGLPDICFMCGRYGHSRNNCDMTNRPTSDKSGEVHNTDKAIPQGNDPDMSKDAEMGNENEALVSDGLRGPWMIVPPRRRNRNGGKDWNSKPTPTGSRFEALRHEGESSGEKDANGIEFGDQAKLGQADKLKRVDGVGQKVWTKSKATKGGPRLALNDISNNSLKKNGKVTTQEKIGKNPYKPNHGAVTTQGKMATGTKQVNPPKTMLKQMDGWVNDHLAKQNDGVYIFGHQPPNIDNHGATLETLTEHGATKEHVMPAQEEANPLERIDLSKDQERPIYNQAENNTFNTVEGMIIGL